MKCYIATVEMSVMFVSELEPTHPGLEQVGRDLLQDEIDENGIYGKHVGVYPALAIPVGWDGNSLVRGTDEDMTAEQALRLNEEAQP